jgi:hypothetical protein
MALHAPAEPAHVVAFVYRRRHLKASVAFDPVEVLFVTIASVDQALPHPVAQFHRGVVIMQTVLLFYQ